MFTLRYIMYSIKLVYRVRIIFVAIRLGQLDLLEILLCLLVTHTNMATQCQKSPIG